MGRKAKDAAQQKISEWTGSRRNASKTTTKKENTSAPPTEIRAPLKTHSPSDMNAMKNCTVRLDIIKTDPKPIENMTKKPAKKLPSATITSKDKETDKRNIYDYSFDADDFPNPDEEHDDAMKDIIEKLAKENKIEVKKYRPKNVKKKKPDEKDPIKKATMQKRRRVKQPTDAEPPQKKPNLRNKQISVDIHTSDALSSNENAKTIERNSQAEILANNNNNLTEKAANIVKPNETVSTSKVAIESNQRKAVAASANMENINIQSKLRSHNNLQSTPKSSTPLNVKAAAKGKENNRSLFFDNASPLINTTGTNLANNVRKQRLQLSAINDSQEIEITSPNTTENQNEPQPIQHNFDDDDFDFGNNVANEREPMHVPNSDKENSLDRPGTSASALSAHNRPATSTASSRLWNQPGTSAAAASTSWDRPGTSAAAFAMSNESNERTPTNNQDISDSFNIYTPTKRRVYGRSPLKNITSEVNNTNSPSFESMKSVASVPRSFGMLAKSTLNSIQTNNSAKTDELTLPEVSYFTSRRDAEDFDRIVDDSNIIDDCFGFDIGDDDEPDNNVTNKTHEQTSNETKHITKPETGRMIEIRSKLKRFLHHPEKLDETVKKSKTNNKATRFKSPAKTLSKTPAKTPGKTPGKSPAKAAKSPAKVKRNVFGENVAKQKDIRSAFAARSEKDKNSKDDAAVTLFQEFETVQDRRKSYSKPQRQRKRRISVDTDESDAEHNSDDEEFDADGKKAKRSKRRKIVELEAKDVEELEDYAKKTNEHFEEIDSFVMMVE